METSLVPKGPTRAEGPPLSCPVCGEALIAKMARGRKSGKVFVMLLCSVDGRHLRAFITDQKYVQEVISLIESKAEE